MYVGVFDDHSSNGVTGVTCDGAAMTQVFTVLKQGSANILTYLYGITGISAGAHSIVTTRGATSVDALVCGAVSYSGAVSLSDVVGSNTTSGPTANVTASVTTISANSVGLAMSYMDNRLISAGTGSTLLTANLGTVGQVALFESSTFPIVATGSYSMTSTSASPTSNNGMRIIALAPTVTANGNFLTFF